MNYQFNVPEKGEVSEKNQKLFDQMQKSLHQVPNLYATFAYSENALGAYLDVEHAPTSLRQREVEAVNLAVSEVNQCVYCLSAHRVIAKAKGFSEEEVAELRTGKASFDPKLNALTTLAKSVSEQRGHVDAELIRAFFDAGYTKENLVDTIMLIGIRTITNFQHAITKVPVDFELAPGFEASDLAVDTLNNNRSPKINL